MYYNEIINNLNHLYESNNIPNIIFHGENHSGKKSILEYFINKIYLSKDNIKKHVMIINCAHGKGNIKYIRDNLKFFANSIIDTKNGSFFKSIILLNADKLTFDAQSALRRCIELHNHSTRFFIVIDDKNKILKPILSRFSEVYVSVKTNTACAHGADNFCQKKINGLPKLLDISYNTDDYLVKIMALTEKLYESSYSANLLIENIKNKLPDSFDKYKFLLLIQKYKKEFRNEKILIFFVLNFIYFRKNGALENISFTKPSFKNPI